MADVTNTPSYLTVFLTLWGGTVPLIVGWLSNRRARKIQIEDRKFEEDKSKRLLARTDDEKKIQNLIEYKQQSLLETRRVILSFLDKANLYVQSAIKAHSVIPEMRDGNYIHLLQAKQVELTNSFNEVFILVDDESLLKCCRRLLNETSDSCPDFSKIPSPIELSDYSVKCVDKRSYALDAARKFLKNLEQEILNLQT